MATKTEAEETQETPTEGHDGPLLDLSDAAVKRMIKQAKKRGYVTYDQLNEVLPSEEVTSEQIEDTMSMLSDMGINVIESEEAEENEEAAKENAGGDLVEATTSTAVAKTTTTREPADRTDDPVRMYLREMGSVELLSREGEIAIAKRIEAGREMMIGGHLRKPADHPAPSSPGTTCWPTRPRCCCAISSTSRPPTAVPAASRTMPRAKNPKATSPKATGRAAPRPPPTTDGKETAAEPPKPEAKTDRHQDR